MLMKTALCLSGLTRSIEKGYSSIKKYLIDPYNADVFIHTWDINVEGRFAHAPAFKNVSKNDILKELNPIVLKIENYETIKNKFINQNRNISAMYYSIAQANEYKKRYEKDFNFKYSLVIRSRMDSLYHESLPENEVEECLGKDLVFVRFSGINKNGFISRQNFDYNSQTFVADNFAFGNSKTMDIYGETYYNLERFFNTAYFISSVPECILGKQLNENKIEYRWSNIRFKSLVHWDDNNCIYESDYEQKEQISL